MSAYGRWRWLVRGYYGPDAEPPRREGDLAIEVGGLTREALALDVKVLEQRADIGVVEGPFEVTS